MANCHKCGKRKLRKRRCPRCGPLPVKEIESVPILTHNKETWMPFARGIMKSVDAASSIGAVNAIELHNASRFRELQKVSPKMHDHLIGHIDMRRIYLAKQVEKA